MIKVSILLSLVMLTFSTVPKITVYVESLCPGCNQLESTVISDFYDFANNSQLGELEVIYYGNAKEIQEASGFTYKCQHGEAECVGNIKESCVQRHLELKKSHKILSCISKTMYDSGMTADFTRVFDDCVGDATDLSTINSCVANEASQIQHENAANTGTHKYVPWIILDGVHTDEIQNQISNNMVGYLCNLAKKRGSTVEGCDNTSNESIKFLDFENDVCYNHFAKFANLK